MGPAKASHGLGQADQRHTPFFLLLEVVAQVVIILFFFCAYNDNNNNKPLPCCVAVSVPESITE